MAHLTDGLGFRDFRVLLSHHCVIFLLLIQSSAGESQVIGRSQPIVATVGDDVVLPCYLEPAVDVSYRTVEWTRPDLDPRFIHVVRYGAELESVKHPSYRGRTSVFTDELRHGDVSLKLSKVEISDGGTYRCSIPDVSKSSLVELVVGAVSSPVIVSINIISGGLVLQCESEGWYPEPEVSWLDGEGHVLSAGPTETVRGPDGLYTVSSRLTVEKRHSDNFTCRVQQKDINQIRDTQICVTDDVSVAQTVVPLPWIIVSGVVTVVALPHLH